MPIGSRLQPSILRIPFLLFIVSIVLFEFPGAKALVETPYSGIETLNLIVQHVQSRSPNRGRGIERGDEIVSIDGVRVRNFNHLRYLVHQHTDFGPQEYTFRRGDSQFSEFVEYIAIPPPQLYRRFAYVLVAFTFLLVGLLVLMRRDDRLGILFSLNCAILAFFLTDRPILSSSLLQLLGELFHDGIILMFPAVFLHFFLVFPERSPSREKAAPWKHPGLLYVLPAALFAVSSVLAARKFFGGAVDPRVVGVILGVSTVYFVFYLIASIAVFILHYRSSSVAQKLKLRIVIAGTIAGIIPFVALTAVRQFSPGAETFLEPLAVGALAFISVSFAYAILKHGAIQLHVVVRKSLVYAFLTGAIIAIYYAVVNLVGDFFTRELHLRPAFLSLLSIFLIAIIFAPARDLVQRAVDRTFFRTDYEYRHEIVDFNRQLSRKLTRAEILDYFFEKVTGLLQASFLATYMKRKGEVLYRDRSSGDAPSRLPGEFPLKSSLGRFLARTPEPLMVEYLDFSWRRQHLDESSHAFLERTQAAVCLPVVSHGAFIGLVLLGPKRSRMLYSRADAQLLETFAEHLGAVIQNADLHEAAIEQNRLKSEVLLAREIQLSLLPKAPPRHPSLEVMGKMMSSEEIGGDYYDYFALDENRIGVVVGDVSGKGIPAAMLMASLQTAFKNLALKDKMSPVELLVELNRYLCGTAKNGQFATLIYGILDLEGQNFTFSSAGQCPALLIKPNFADRLGEGGMPLGVSVEHEYRQGRVRIEPGDLLCMYTDGVIEQRNPTGEQFGEERLIAFLQANKNLPLPALQEALFATLGRFGADRQDDDVTSIIARYKAP